jgi:hypothetical protein
MTTDKEIPTMIAMNRDAILELVESGMMSPYDMLDAVLKFMSNDEVSKFATINDFDLAYEQYMNALEAEWQAVMYNDDEPAY